ncbi:DUF3592 domain-containing protein [Streptomyces sp. YC504]|uniref:DUF3592 domain-containing protein n=1 Tax=Streptomyces mesophilus TaxID=1775132 RepID=A0A6G4XQ31_9ACTN|nr:DUF3592 domain-containing protein [Streptomyces mesophilus]NGO79323.1 DUF3592 domain-containing protein [Streptomyces mesophilus]
MDFFFYAVPLLMIAVLVGAAVKLVGRDRQLRAAWSSGLTAEARCLRFYTTTRRSDDSTTTTRHHVFEFVTRDGRTVRFEEENGPATILEGDVVPVHYTAERPEQATARAPRGGVLTAQTTGTLVFLGVMVAFLVVFMGMYTSMSSGMDPMMP